MRWRRFHPYRSVLLIAVLGWMALQTMGCATSYDKRGVYHRVRGGESIQRIARIYRTDIQELAEFNNILNPDDIQPGQRLYIPPRKKSNVFKKLPFGQDVVSKSHATPGTVATRGRQAKYSGNIQLYRGRFEWPVKGKVTSAFGVRDGRRHDGIDISAPSGAPIHAAAAGRVVYTGTMRGYGKLILIRHKENMFTAYAHNSANLVRKGASVKQGQLIGKVGKTGRASGSHLHFEIRHGQISRNPLFFLPDRG